MGPTPIQWSEMRLGRCDDAKRQAPSKQHIEQDKRLRNMHSPLDHLRRFQLSSQNVLVTNAVRQKVHATIIPVTS